MSGSIKNSKEEWRKSKAKLRLSTIVDEETPHKDESRKISKIEDGGESPLLKDSKKGLKEKFLSLPT